MAWVFKNFISTSLEEALPSSGKSIKLVAARSPMQEVPSSGKFRLILKDDPLVPTKLEIIEVSGSMVSGARTILSRGLEGTQAQDFPAGASVELCITAHQISQIQAGTGTGTGTTPGGGAQVGHKHTLEDITDSGVLAGKDKVTSALLVNTGVTPGVYLYPKITVQEDGRLSVVEEREGAEVPHDVGFFANAAELRAAHPAGSLGDFARIGDTKTYWKWSAEGQGSWLDSGVALPTGTGTDLSQSVAPGGEIVLESSTGNNTTLGFATTLKAGLMSKADKSRIESGLTSLVKDTTPELGGDLNAKGHVITGNLSKTKWVTQGTSVLNHQTGLSWYVDSSTPVDLGFLADAPVGLHGKVVQAGAGQVTLVPGGSGEIKNSRGHTKTNGVAAQVSFEVAKNVGNAPIIYIQGDTI